MSTCIKPLLSKDYGESDSRQTATVGAQEHWSSFT